LAGGRSEEIANMQVTKLRASADANGLVPAGAYFANLSRKLQDANARETAMRAQLDEEDRRLEARYRRSSASRANTYAQEDMHA
jgi:hypothetical protein